MPSRFWLSLAFVAAFGANPAHAQTAPRLVAVVLDQATVEKLPAGVMTLVIGNPMIADVTMLKTGSAMVVTAKGYGQTNLIALDSDGAVLPVIPIACRRCSLATIRRVSMTPAARFPAATATRWAGPSEAGKPVRAEAPCAA